MPVLADMEMAREIILPALRTYGDQTLKLQGLLQADGPVRDVRVDNFHSPTAVMLKVGGFLNFFARDEEIGRHLLHELSWHWSKPLAFAGVAEELVPLIAECADIEWNQPCHQYYLPQDKNVSDLRSEVGAVLDMGFPEPEHAALILEHWPYGDPDSEQDREYVTRCLERGPSSAFYDGEQLVSWALCGDDMSMGMMHTLASHRRRGIARLVTAHLTVQVCDGGHTPYCYVVAGNEPPIHLLEELGYVRSEGRYCWLGTTPRSNES